MELISGIIPVQNFELIRDAIGVILGIEFANQYVISGQQTPNPTIYRERLMPFDLTECPAVNITLYRGDYSDQDPKNTEARYRYSIEVYTRAKTTATARGDYLAVKELHRIIGMIRAILESPIYDILGFKRNGTILNRHIESIQVPPATNDKDATFSAQAAIVLNVRAVENQMLIDQLLNIQANTTTVLIGNTNRGYVWKYERLHEQVYDSVYE